MKRFFAVAASLSALGFAVSSPAQADYAVVKFDHGYCRIWRDSGATPWGNSWTKIATSPDFEGAWAAKDAAIKNGTCR